MEHTERPGLRSCRHDRVRILQPRRVRWHEPRGGRQPITPGGPIYIPSGKNSSLQRKNSNARPRPQGCVSCKLGDVRGVCENCDEQVLYFHLWKNCHFRSRSRNTNVCAQLSKELGGGVGSRTPDALDDKPDIITLATSCNKMCYQARMCCTRPVCAWRVCIKPCEKQKVLTEGRKGREGAEAGTGRKKKKTKKKVRKEGRKGKERTRRTESQYERKEGRKEERK